MKCKTKKMGRELLQIQASRHVNFYKNLQAMWKSNFQAQCINVSFCKATVALQFTPMKWQKASDRPA